MVASIALDLNVDTWSGDCTCFELVDGCTREALGPFSCDANVPIGRQFMSEAQSIERKGQLTVGSGQAKAYPNDVPPDETSNLVGACVTICGVVEKVSGAVKVNVFADMGVHCDGPEAKVAQ